MRLMSQNDPQSADDRFEGRKVAEIRQASGMRAGISAQAWVSHRGGIHEPLEDVELVSLSKIGIADKPSAKSSPMLLAITFQRLV
jgi:hypothetical protein